MNARVLQEISVAVAQEHSLHAVLRRIVDDLAAEPGVALARIWLLGPGDLCSDCALERDCTNRETCLHLEASAGRSTADPGRTWSRTDGTFRRFPLGVRKVGSIGASGEAKILRVREGDGWLAAPSWAASEGIRTFAGQPLIFRGETLGVLGVFSRSDVSDEEFSWLRTFADHAAVALANARAFGQIEELRRQLELERDYLREEIKVAQAPGGIVGRSPAIQKVLQQIEVVAPTEATTLITGESGTGKELVAAAIHERSERSGRPLVRVNCASIPHELFESEFFGHLRGAFTGALDERAGRFQIADGGTLFLDEVGEIPIELQGKLLRALQEGRFSRVGEDVERSVDVRLVAATNRDLEEEVRAGRFREDLYYRLTVFPIRLPALRERREDVAQLAMHFLGLAAKSGRLATPPRLRESQARELEGYDWPGNVRELQNVVERAVIGARKAAGLVFEVPRSSGRRRDRRDGAGTAREGRELLREADLRKLERDNALAVLERVRWKISGPGGAAEFLGVNATTLTSRLKAMGIERPRAW
ncbi:MAG: sigma 54-interacting transcriptional regulator [Planctomycetota bacterium]